MGQPLDRPKDDKPVRSKGAPLSGSTRRHLGEGLRAHYAEVLTEPVDPRIAALLARLEKPPA
ncbi:NepR family anti-sigma factor [Methylobacterium organophilum]|uniref:Anti-sigma factor NepR domain-containing protein n=1 Tax=Methylobacterium organophilum TaxID=410 RepID=A0ABQ4TGL4_METOR|nr:NepR family anti-sigma factor [Methylobacterium organophilum]UMY18587.1 hypothetical protein MMB17_04450 [Methylobacterium organophilum]GJE29469.1 hypothetical protein LKMONMHP_4350 [Methylobacterium organophilum]